MMNKKQGIPTGTALAMIGLILGDRRRRFRRCAGLSQH